MKDNNVQNILQEISKLDANEKGQLLSMFLFNERKSMKGDRNKYLGCVKQDYEITDEDIKSCQISVNYENLLK